MNQFGRYTFIIIILSLLCVNTPIFALIIDVPADRPTIQSGIDAAKNGDTVLVADGIYRGEGNVNIDFKGKQITVQSRNGAKTTIIDCGRKAETRGFTFQNEETDDSELDGFTIRNGVHELGGGIYCNNASPTIKNCVITKNRSVAPSLRGHGGGGIYCFNSDAVIIACKIIDNSANSDYGGGVLFTGITRETKSQPSLINCTISMNEGDGVFCYDNVNPVIKDCTVSQNNGRGIVYNHFARGNNTITNCLITQNSGSGIECRFYSYMNITDSIITRNKAEFGGGISCGPSARIEVSDCVISQNIATETGGGIDVVSNRGDAEISYCTITQNSADERGGGIFVESETSFTLTDSIVWGNNSEGTHAEVFAKINWGGMIIFRSCDIKRGLKGIGREADGQQFIYEDNIDKDPLFVNVNRGDYRLKPHSPAAAMGAKSSFIDRALNVTSVGKRLVMWADLKRK